MNFVQFFYIFCISFLLLGFGLFLISFVYFFEQKTLSLIYFQRQKKSKGKYLLRLHFANLLKKILKSNDSDESENKKFFVATLSFTAAFLGFSTLVLSMYDNSDLKNLFFKTESGTTVYTIYFLTLASIYSEFALLKNSSLPAQKVMFLRFVGRFLATEIIILLSLISVTVTFETDSLFQIISMQNNPGSKSGAPFFGIVGQPLSFLFLIIGLYSRLRIKPYLFGFGSSDIYVDKYRSFSISDLIFSMNKYLNIAVYSLFITVLFFPLSFKLPVIESQLYWSKNASALIPCFFYFFWAFCLLAVIFLIQAISTKLRADQFLKISWTMSQPLAFLNLVYTLWTNK